MNAAAHRPDAREVSAALASRAEDLAVHLLGEPSLRGRGELRWGRRGSFALATAGAHRGEWFDHEAGEGGDMLALIRRERRSTFPEALAWALTWLGEAPPPRQPERREAHQRPSLSHGEASPTLDLARRIWRESVPAAGTLVEAYLRSRGLTLDPDAPLRYHPMAWRDRANGPAGPAMIAAMTDAATGEWRGAHVTYLRADGSGKAGGEAAKIKLGRTGVIRLSPDDAVTTGLGIAEGIETSLSVMQHFGWRPVWSATSAGAIRTFPVLPGIEALAVFADIDAKGTGMDAAQACAVRWREAGREARIIAPPVGDWNDAQRRAA